jgi:PIN domain nuclease of toxin-antitoxin system
MSRPLCLLADTHVLLALLHGALKDTYPIIAESMMHPETKTYASVASLWEIAIKTRLKKLDPGAQLEDIPELLSAGGLIILPIETAHAITEVTPEAATKDPFDRLLLAQCQVEGLKLATMDRKLIGHRLVFRA